MLRLVFLRFLACSFVLSLCSAFAQQPRDAQPLPDDPDKLVASMAGENLPAASRNRKRPDGPAWRAAEALRSLKDDAIPALTRGLESGDRTIRLNVVFVLAGIGTPATLPLRIKGVSDADPEVRAQAVASLPAYKSDDARKAVFKALRDPDPAVRNAAIRALKPRNEGPDNQIRFSIAGVLIPLLDDPATQYNAVDVLGQLGMNSAARPLLKLLKIGDAPIRSVAAEALGRLKDKQITMELTAALSDPDPNVRMRAANSLGDLGDLRATPSLVGLLSDEQFFLRRDAAHALGQIGDVRAVPSLIRLLDDPDERVQASAAEALGQIGDVRAVEPLCGLLVRKDRDHSAVARALGRLRDPRAIKPLKDYLLARESRGSGSRATADCRDAADAFARIRHPDSVRALVEVILNARDPQAGLHARRALSDIVGGAFSHVPNETVAEWWDLNREGYLLPIPEKK